MIPRQTVQDAPGPLAKIAPAKRFSFTMNVLERLQPPAKGRLRVHDAKTRWLTLVVTPQGAKSFYVLRRVGGRTRQICLGPFPTVTVDQARTAAGDINVQLGHGEDPVQAKRTARAETTLQALFNTYLADYALPHKKSAALNEQLFDRLPEPWRAKRLSTITQAEVQRLHAQIGQERGPYAGNRTLALLSKMFSFARGTGYTAGNPCQGVKKFREQSRERFLDGAELGRFHHALMAEPNEVMRDFFLVALYTGARRANAQAMRWADVNLDRSTWTIPAAQAKGGVPLTVYLPAPALEVLAQRRKADPTGEWVFPSSGKTGHLMEPKSAWRRILKVAGLDDLRIHDLRRTLGSWQAASGTSLAIIGKSLGHKSQATTAIYARLNIDPVKAAVDTATAAMVQAALNPKGDKA